MDPSSNVQSMSNELLMAAGTQSKSNELLLAAGLGDVEQIKRLLQQHEEEDVAIQVVPHVEEDVLHGQAGPAAAAAIADADAVTATGDSILHVVAAGGHARFVECATVIVGRANNLLGSCNSNGDTPVHCAARLGHAKMVSNLLALARARFGDGDERLKAILRTQNSKGETVLHEAISSDDMDMVGALLSADSQLARVPLADGVSPLYLALLLDLGHIARQLFAGDEALSYSGPDGRNAFHAAILGTQGKESIEMLLERNKDLLRQADRSTGSTPLHLAAKWEGPIELLLKADPAAAYLRHNNGSFPVHVAALECGENAVLALLRSSPGCAELRDGKGRTFLHVAAAAAEVENGVSLVTKACRWHDNLFPSSVMNMQDDDGNTPLHLAILADNIRAVRALASIPEVKLSLRNNKREKPLETAFIRAHSAGSYLYKWNPRYRIFHMLRDGFSSRIIVAGTEFWSALGEMDRSQNIAGQAQIIGLGSVLITTVTFAAAFAVPGGYRADDHDKGGTPTLAGNNFFDAFVIANTLAFICSALSMLFLMYAGVGSSVVRRMWSFFLSVNLLANSARSLGAAFALGMYSILAPVERSKAIYSCVITVSPLVVVELFWSIVTVKMVYCDKAVMVWRWFQKRQARGMLRALAVLVLAISVPLMSQFLPYIIIMLPFTIKGSHA